ncbi:MAG: ABC transporter permease, partial [Clostridia bacterium]
MVVKKALYKDTIKEIKNTYKRFLSILLIILLGAGFFAGIKVIYNDMQNSADVYFDESNFMDFRLVSTLGLTNEDIEEIKKVDNVDNVIGSNSFDCITNIDDKDVVVKLHTYIDNSINKFKVVEGNMPISNNECLVERTFLTYNNKKIGDIFKIDNDKDVKFKSNEFKIVGVIESPLYMSYERGNTSKGNGKISGFMYVLDDVIDTDIYTEVYLTLKDTKNLNTFSNKYKDNINKTKVKLEDLGEKRKDIRYESIVSEANLKINDAKKELQDGIDKQTSEVNDARKKI